MIFENEARRALSWFFSTQNLDNFGWSWVRDISPNQENTAEVVYTALKFSSLLSETQIEFLNEAVSSWLLYPALHASITVDWAWTALALDLYEEQYDLCQPDFSRQEVRHAIESCARAVVGNQNADGGWADYQGDSSMVTRTALCVFSLVNILDSNPDTVEMQKAIDRGIQWLLSMQQECGGWGNTAEDSLSVAVISAGTKIDSNTVHNQYAPSAAATGYSILALSTADVLRFHKPIHDGIEFLKELYCEDQQFPIFFECGIRRESLFTFRHFGTAWACLGLLRSGQLSCISDLMLSCVRYLLSLQDFISGGFRSSSDSDVYTWSTCNALMTLREMGDALQELSAKDYLEILVEYIKRHPVVEQSAKDSMIE